MSAVQLALLCATVFLAACAAVGRLRFVLEEFAPLWRRIFAAVLLVVVLAAIVFYPITEAPLRAAFDPEEVQFPELFVGHIVLLIFLLVWWALRSSRRATPISMFATGELVSDLRWGCIVGIGGWIATMAVTLTAAIIVSRFSVTSPGPDEVPPLMVWLAGLPTARKLLVIGAAMTVEEGFFRGFLQTRLGLGLSTILFTAAHASYGLPFMLVSVMTISLLIGGLYQWRGRLLPCVVAHGIFDGIQLLIVLPWAVQLLHAAP